MGIFSDCDIICSDSMLEVCLEMLIAAGIGPSNYKKSTKTIIEHRSGGVSFYFGRYTPEEYDEYFSCIAEAADKPAVLEKHGRALLEIANREQIILDQDDLDEDDIIVGNGFQILALLLMQAGCVIGPRAKHVFLLSFAQDLQCRCTRDGGRNFAKRNRRVIIRTMYAIAENYDGRGRVAIRYESRGFLPSIIRNRQRSWRGAMADVIERVTFRETGRTHIKSSIFTTEYLFEVKSLVYKTSDLKKEGFSKEKVLENGNDVFESKASTSNQKRSNKKKKKKIISKGGANLQKMRMAIEQDMAGFNAKEMCWNCGNWAIYNNKPGVNESSPELGGTVVKFRCSACKQAFYCSKDCQNENWAKHKKWCSKQRCKSVPAEELD